MNTISRIARIISAMLLSAAAPYAPPDAGVRVIYRHSTLINPGDQLGRPDIAVITSGERITAVIPDNSLTRAQLDGSMQVDLRGQFLLPGYIDSHQHFATPPDRKLAEARLKRDIYSGITATRDMADDLRQIGDVTRAALVGDIASPDIYYAALVAGPSFFVDPRTQAIAAGAIAGKVPWEQEIDEKTAMPFAIAQAKGTYATAVKIYANLPSSLVRRITLEAHRQKMKVWAHGMVFPATPLEVVDAGVDTVSHTCYLAYQAMSRRPGSYQNRFPLDAALFERDNPVMKSLFLDMNRRGTVLDATLHVYREVEAAAKKAGTAPLCTVELAARLTNQAYRSNVAISTGTDGDSPADDPWPALFDEFRLLGGPAGMKPSDVIRAATLTGAKAAGQEADMGSIEPGKLANMVILSANPLNDVANLSRVVMTVKRGRRFARSEYLK